MKVAVLCNGPSREVFRDSLEYEFVIGCNIPWTVVDATVILDPEVIHYLAKHPQLINIPAYFSRKAWMITDEIKKRKFFEPYLIELIDPKYPYHSAGHVAVEAMIRKGATEIDIFGCDSWFESTIESYTHQYVDTSDETKRCIEAWRTKWKTIIENNPNVTINFIKGNL